jgi:hypothetical protein
MRRSLAVDQEDVDDLNIVDEIEDDNDSDRPDQVGFVYEEEDDLREPLQYVQTRQRMNSIKFKPVYHDSKSVDEVPQDPKEKLDRYDRKGTIRIRGEQMANLQTFNLMEEMQ